MLLRGLPFRLTTSSLERVGVARGIFLPGILILVGSLFPAFSALAGESARTAVLERRVLELRASEIGPAEGREIERLSVVAWTGDAFVPVPFQIDQIGQADLVWFDGTGLDGPGETGVFSGDDRLLVLFGDAGERAPEGARPEQGELLAELGLHDQKRPGLYLYIVRDYPERSERRYIDHDPDTGVAHTSDYTLEVDPDNELTWKHLGFHSYAGEGSIIDSLHMRMSGGFLFARARMTLDEDNLRPDVLGARVGPIRSVLHVRTRVVLAGVTVLRLHMQAYRYPSHFEAHSYAEVPGLYQATIREPRVEVALRGKNQHGAMIRTARGGEVEGQVDGALSSADQRLVDKGLASDESWIYFDSKRDFTLLTELDVPEELAGIPLELIFEDEPDRGPLVGYAMKGWPPEREMRFTLRMLFDSGLGGLDPPEYARLRTSRPEIRITPAADR